MAITKTQVSQLYVSIFGRASEGEGNAFWQTSATTTTAADLMFQQQVVKDYFNVTDFTSEANVRTVVETIYLNALGKTPTDDPTGIQFWVDSVIVNGDSIGTMAAALTFAATQPGNAGTAQDIFNNKVAVSDHTADTIETFTDFAQFQGYIANVDETQASVDAAISDVDADALAFTLTADAATVEEGSVLTFTVTSATAVATDTDVVFTLQAGDTAAADTGTSNTNNNDFQSTADVTVTIPAGQTTATFDVTGIVDQLAEQTESFSVKAVVNGETLTKTATLTDPAPGATFVLTTGQDNETANIFFASQTVFNIDGVGPTLNPGDVLTGEAGRTDNTLTVTDLTAGAAFNNIPAGVQLNNIQTVNLNTSGNTAAGVGFSTVNFAGVENLFASSNGGGNDFYTAKNSVGGTVVKAEHSGFTGNTTVVGGTDVTVTTSGGNARVGNPGAGITVPLATEVATGAVVVNQNNSGAGNVQVYGGATVKVTTTSTSNSGAINIGNTAGNTGNNAAGGVANASDEITVKTAGSGAVTVFGGTNVSVENTALAGAGAITVGDNTNTLASNLPTGNVTITETAAIAYNGLAGSANNNTASGAITVAGGADVSVTTNASNTINIGNLSAAKEDAVNATGAISVVNTGIVTAAAAGAVRVTGGTTVDVTTTGANVMIGRAASGVIDSASNPTGNVTVTETMNGAGFARAITVDGGADITVNAKGQSVNVGTSTASAPTGAIVVNQSDIFTGNAAILNATNAGNVVVNGGTTVTVNTTGGNVTVGGVVSGANVVPSDAVSITNTFSGAGSDSVSVLGGTTVDITTTKTSGAISVGAGSNALNAAGTALKDADLAPTGDVTIVDATTVGSQTAYGTGNVNVYANGATTVSIKGGNVDNVQDIQATLQTGGANAGQAVGTSTLTDVVIDGLQNTDGVTIASDVLANLSLLNTKGANTVTVTNNTAAHALTITQGGNKVATMLVDAKAGSVTITDNATDSKGVLTLQATKATSLTVDNAAKASLNIGSNATDLDTLTLQGAGDVTFASTDKFGTGNLNKLVSVDATAATGDITAAFTAKTDTTTQSYQGGSGVDTLTIDSNVSGWGTNVSVNGGNGTSDVIVANYAAAGTDAALGNASSVNGFEILKLGTLAIGAYDASGFSTIQAAALAGSVTISNAASGVTLDILSADANTINVSGANTASTSNAMTVGLGKAATHGAITANGIETLTVNSTGKDSTATINGIATNGAATLVVEGNKSLTLTSNAGFTGIDATAATGKMVDVRTADVSNAGTTFTGGASMLKAMGSNDSGAYKALVTMSDTDATDLAAGDSVTVNVNGTTFVYVVAAGNTALVSEAAASIATLINAQSATGSTNVATNGTTTQTGVNVLSTSGAIASGGNIVLVHNAPFAVDTSASDATTTINDSLLGGQQQDSITVTAAAAAGNTLSVDINGTTVTYTATAADANPEATAQGLATAIANAGLAGVASATTDGNGKVIITSQIGQTNIVDNVATGGAVAATGPVETVNMATVSNLVTSGAGGVDYTLGLGGSWDTVSHSFSSGSETVDLTASVAKTDTIQAKDGAVATFNGSTGGVAKFTVDSQDASDVINFVTANKAIVANAVTGTVNTVNSASTMASIIDSSGSLATKLANLTYVISNGVITFGATGGHSLSEFTSGELISAAQILVSSSTTGGADRVAAFSSNGHSYVVASDVANTLATSGTDSKSTIIDLKDVADVKGFGSTFGEATVVASNVTTISSPTINTLATSTTQDATGFAMATLNAAGTAAANTNTTNFTNLASSAVLNVTATGNAHLGQITTTQVGTSGHNSLTVDMVVATTIDSLTTNGDAVVYMDAANVNNTITSLIDATNTMNTVVINGNGGVLTTVTGTALTTIDASAATGAFNFGDATHIDAHNDLTVKLDGANVSTLWTSGANNTFTQETAAGAVTLNASGSNNTMTLSNGGNTITANGANNTIKVGTGANTITATGSDDTITVVSGAITTVTVGANATVNLGKAGVADTGADTVKVGSALSGGDSSNFAKTTIDVLSGTHTGGTDVVIDFSNTSTTTNIIVGQVNVESATTLAEALDLAANYTLLSQAQGTAASIADLAGLTSVVDWFQYEGDTYVVSANNFSATAVQQTALDANDQVVQLVGMVDLSAATYNAVTDTLSF